MRDREQNQRVEVKTKEAELKKQKVSFTPFTSSFSQGPSPEEHLMQGYAFCMKEAIQKVIKKQEIDFNIGSNLEIFQNETAQYALKIHLSVQFPDLDTKESERILKKAEAICVYPATGNIVEVETKLV